MLPSQVYRFKPSTGQIWCVADGFVQCNGLCFSPDYKKMYITDTAALQAHGTPANGQNISINPRLPASIYSFDVVDDGTRLVNRQMFAYCDVGVCLSSHVGFYVESSANHFAQSYRSLTASSAMKQETCILAAVMESMYGILTVLYSGRSTQRELSRTSTSRRTESG